MKDVGQFADAQFETSTYPGLIDTARKNVTGSTVDQIYADAIKASQPTLVVDKYKLLQRQDVPGDIDRAIFPTSGTTQTILANIVVPIITRSVNFYTLTFRTFNEKL